MIAQRGNPEKGGGCTRSILGSATAVRINNTAVVGRALRGWFRHHSASEPNGEVSPETGKPFARGDLIGRGGFSFHGGEGGGEQDGERACAQDFVDEGETYTAHRIPPVSLWTRIYCVPDRDFTAVGNLNRALSRLTLYGAFRLDKRVGFG